MNLLRMQSMEMCYSAANVLTPPFSAKELAQLEHDLLKAGDLWHVRILSLRIGAAVPVRNREVPGSNPAGIFA